MSAAFLRKYATITHIYIPIVKRAVVDYALSADWTPAASDVKVSIDGGAAANIGTLPTAITMGNTAMWDFTISAAEVTGRKISITISDAATKVIEDQMFDIETYGHASAEYQADFSAANLPSAVNSIAANAITAASIASNAITAAKIATDAISAAKIAADAVTKIQLGLSTLTQAQVTGGAYALNSSSFGFNAALDFTTTQKAATLARVTLTDTATSVANGVTVTTNNDKAGYTLTTGDHTLIAQRVEEVIINEADSNRVVDAIVQAIAAANPDLDDLSASLIATAVRTELAAELARIDVVLSTRAPATTALSNATWTDTKAGYLDVATSSRAPSATALSNATWTDVKAGYLDAAVSGATAPTVQSIVDGILDELMAGHTVAGSVAASLRAAGLAGDPLATELPGAYTTTQAGGVLYRVMSLPLNPITATTPLPRTFIAGDIEMFRGELFRPEPMQMVYPNGDPIDLSGKTLAFVVQYADGHTIAFQLTTTAGELTIGGTGNSYVTFVGPKLSSTLHGRFKWNIRDITGGISVRDTVLSYGNLLILNYRDATNP